MTYISQSHTWADPTASTEDVITAVKLNGNNDDFIDGLKDGTKDINCNQITAALTGNSSTSTTITSRNLNLKGDLVASQAFDGSAPVTWGADNVKSPVARAVISYGWSLASQAIMDTKAAAVTAPLYDEFSWYVNNFIYLCMQNKQTELHDLIVNGYNVTFASDPLSITDIIRLTGNLGPPHSDPNFLATLESATNIQFHSSGTKLDYEESPTRLTSWLSLTNLGDMSQRFQIVTTSFCAAGCIPDAASSNVHVQEKEIPLCTSTFDEGGYPVIEINIPLKIPNNYVSNSSYPYFNYLNLFYTPYLIHITVYKGGV
tara:strand:- start:6439 stop:7386 length:948 start_codon:yes stop_codon:yes gene_type:complete